MPTEEVLRTYGPDYRVIFVGDASMSPYELTHPGGANEHWNAEPGAAWLGRAREAWAHSIWVNPLPERFWGYTPSVEMVAELFEGRMYPMTLEGLERGIRALAR